MQELIPVRVLKKNISPTTQAFLTNSLNKCSTHV